MHKNNVTKKRIISGTCTINLFIIIYKTIGTHELDDGTEVLSQYLKNLTYPIVSCNIDATNLPNLTSQYTSSVVLDVGGETVGVIGYITTKARYLVSAGIYSFFVNVYHYVMLDKYS